jgi:hypothetical protein
MSTRMVRISQQGRAFTPDCGSMAKLRDRRCACSALRGALDLGVGMRLDRVKPGAARVDPEREPATDHCGGASGYSGPGRMKELGMNVDPCREVC